jgi:hypothetical protein
MIDQKRVFVSFAIEDRLSKFLFTGQAKNASVPYKFVDMSVKQPWDSEWKKKCETRIKGCDGVIVLVSKNLKDARGACWEIKCARKNNITIRGIYIDGATSRDKPDELDGVLCKEWTWANVKAFIETL